MIFKKRNRGGMLGKKHTEETKKQQSKSMLGWHKNHVPYWLGKKHSEEAKKKMSLAKKGCIPWNKGKKGIYSGNRFHPKGMLGKHHGEETKKKISESKIGSKNPNKSGEKNSFFGKHHSLETRQRWSKMRKGKMAWNKGKGEYLTPEMRAKVIVATLHTQKSKIELKLQHFLNELNIPFEKHKAISGHPDIFIEPNVCIFADGCYWHKCEVCFDKNKFTEIDLKKKAYDNIITAKLKEAGYVVFRFWEHEIKYMCLEEFEKKLLIIKNNSAYCGFETEVNK